MVEVVSHGNLEIRLELMDPIGQGLATNPLQRFFAGAVDRRQQQGITVLQCTGEGLEIDWSVVCWDANLRYSDNGWEPWSFKGTRWQQISNKYRESYLLNAYRVLLSRARQGFVIYVPQGDEDDLTRSPSFYDPIYNALISVGVRPLESKTHPMREAAATPHSLDTGVEI